MLEDNISRGIEIVNTSPCINVNESSLGSEACNKNFCVLKWGTQGYQNESTPLGLIASGMDDGSVSIYNPSNIIKKNQKGLIYSTQKHNEQITCLAFNPKATKYLLSGSKDEQIFVWDLTNPLKPMIQRAPGSKNPTNMNNNSVLSNRYKYIKGCSWNYNVPYIFATCDITGETQIFDLRKKRVAMTFKTRNMVESQCIQWNPGNSRQLAVCYANTTAEIWDLRQPMSPKFYLENGHSRSILDLSWSTLGIL